MKFWIRTLLILLCLTSAGFAKDIATPPPGTILDNSPQNDEWFKKNCVKVQDAYVSDSEITRTCKVNAFESLGKVGKKELYYALYHNLQIMPGDSKERFNDSVFNVIPYNNTAVVILQRNEEGKLQPILAEINSGDLGNDWFEKPVIASQKGIDVVQIHKGIYRGATENHNYILTEGKWSLVASTNKK